MKEIVLDSYRKLKKQMKNEKTLNKYLDEGLCPSLCLKCGFIENLNEYDLSTGFCENCKTYSMKSILILEGLI